MRHLTACAAAVLLLSCCGCSAKEDIEHLPETGSTLTATLDLSLEHAYRAEALDAFGLDHIEYTAQLSGGVLIFGRDVSYGWLPLFFDEASGTVRKAELPYLSESEDTHVVMIMGVTERNGEITVFYSDFDIDAQEMFYYSETYDRNLQLLSEEDLTAQLTGDLYLWRIAADAGGNYCTFATQPSGSVLVSLYDSEFRYIGALQGGVSQAKDVFTAADGSVYLTADGESSTIYRADTQSMVLERVEIVEDLTSVGTFIGGADGLYAYNGNGIYQLGEDGGFTETLNWLNSDMNGAYVDTVAALADGSFLAAVREDGVLQLWHMQERDIDASQMEYISLAACGQDSIIDAVNDFNRSNEAYHIVVMNYDQYRTDENWQAGYEKLQEDIAQGIIADIICINDQMSYETFANKGVFEDLSPYMEADEDFIEEDYYMNVFESLEFRGELHKFTASFDVSTFLGKTEYVGTESGRSLSEMLMLMDSVPEGMQPMAFMTNLSMFNTFVTYNMSAFMDEEKGTCTFDSKEFLEILDYCSQFPSESETQIDWETQPYANNKIMLNSVTVQRAALLHEDIVGRFGTDEVTFLGYPVLEGETGNGCLLGAQSCLAMSSQSLYKAQIWEFFMGQLGTEAQAQTEGFPVRRDAMEQHLTDAMEPQYVTNEDGELVEQQPVIYTSSGEIPIGYFTETEKEAFLAHIEGAAQPYQYNDTIYHILMEETEMYFAGDSTAEQTAEKIQSRVSLYLSEQVG